MRQLRNPARALKLVILVLLLAGTCLPLLAQDLTTSASLTGTVTDSSGAVIPKSTVTVTGVDNGISRAVIADASGDFTVTLLPPGTYNIKVEAKGFKLYESKGFTLLPGQSARDNIQLAVGSEAEEVVVTGQAPILNTGDANLAVQFDAKEVEDLPLNLRNVYGLAVLNSSVQNSTESQTLGEGGTSGKADQDISFLNFGGGFFGTSAYMLDGIWDTDSTWGAVIYVPSVEATADLKIQTNSFTAQSGFSTGNVFQVETKSGTSNFHGDMYEFITNEKVDANTWFNDHNGYGKTPFRRNQFGATAGGPLYIPGLYRQRNKTFIFGLYEGLRQSTPAAGQFSVPTEKMHTGDFSEFEVPTAAALAAGAKLSYGTDALGYPIPYHQLYDPFTAMVVTNGQTYMNPFTGVMSAPAVCPNTSGAEVAPTTCNYRFPIPNNNLAAAHLINPVGAALMTFYPKPTASGYVNNYAGSASAPTTSDEYIIRVDQNISDATRAYFRWAYKYQTKTNSPAYYDAGYGGDDPGGPGNVRPNNRFNPTAGFTHVFNPSTAISANAGFSRWHQGGITQGYPFDFTSIGMPIYLTKNSSQFPIVNTDFSALGPVQGGESQPSTNVGSVGGDLTKSVNKNNLSMGFIYVVLQNNNGNTPPDTTFNFNTGDSADLENVSGATLPNTGSALASMLMGVPATNGNATSNNFNSAPEEKYTGFYFQDDLKLTRRLTLNLGMRWEFQTPWTERHNRLAYFDYNAENPIGGGAVGEEVYVGGNNSRHQNATNFRNFAPRLGFSEQLTHNIVVRGGYGIFYPPAQFTGTMSSPGYQQSSPIVGISNNGLTMGASLSNPFPNGLITPTGNAKGPLTDVGFGASTGVPYVRASPELQEYSLGVQYAFTANDVLTASYVGNRGTHMLTQGVSRSNVNPALVVPGNTLSSQFVPNPYFGLITSSGCGNSLAAATIPLGQSLQPYSEYCNVFESEAPVGDSYYNALQADFNHRYHSGLTTLVSYTFSKFLDDTGGTADWAYVGNDGSSYRNPYNPKMDKSVDGSNIKHSLVANYAYALPFGKNARFASHVNSATDAVIGGWQLTGIVSAKSGFPLHIYDNGTKDPYQGNEFATEVGKPRLTSGRSYQHWFNTAAFQTTPEWSYGTASRFQSDLFAPGYVNFDASLQKVWTLPFERLKLQARGDFFNAFNHTNLYAPNTNNQGSSEGVITNAGDKRQIQGVVKILW